MDRDTQDRLDAAQRAKPVEQAAGRITELESQLVNLTERTAATFAAFDQEVMQLFELVAFISAGTRRLHEVLTILVSDPGNPHSVADKALELLEAPLDIAGIDEAEPGSDDVVPEPAGDQQPDS